MLHGTRNLTGPRLWTISMVQHDRALTATATPATLPALIPPDTDQDERPPHPQPIHHPTQTVDEPPPHPQPIRHPTLTVAPPQRSRAHVRAYDLPNTPALIAYLHATAGYPVKSTWLTAIKNGHYKSWPGLTYDLAARHCPDADETHLGHMAQPRQHIRSTQPRQPRLLTQDDPPPTHSVTVMDIPLTRLFSDDTGRFTPRARSGNQYIMVALHADSNAILIRPFASKSDAHRIAAYQDIFARLAAANRLPTVHIMDNEASPAFQRAITANRCTVQLVPPHVH